MAKEWKEVHNSKNGYQLVRHLKDHVYEFYMAEKAAEKDRYCVSHVLIDTTVCWLVNEEYDHLAQRFSDPEQLDEEVAKRYAEEYLIDCQHVILPESLELGETKNLIRLMTGYGDCI